MHSYSRHQSQFYIRSEWLPYLERLLSLGCIGWCLEASFKENPKSSTIAYVGGASSVCAADFFMTRLATHPPNRWLLRAGGFLSAIGISWCLDIAFEEHPQAAMKACLAGALSMCLLKSTILGDPLASWEESRRPKPLEIKIPEVSSLYYNHPPVPVRLQKKAEDVGKMLSNLTKEFHTVKVEQVEPRLFASELDSHL